MIRSGRCWVSGSRVAHPERSNGRAERRRGGGRAPWYDCSSSVRRLVDDIPTEREQVRARSPIVQRGPGVVQQEDVDRPRTLGRYRLLFPIARGGMGAVYAAVSSGESGAPRTFAIKVLRSEDKSREEVDALVREARLTTLIAHPNVLETFELGMALDEPFVVMPLVKGVTLAKLAKAHAQRRRLLPPTLVAWLGAEIASGLHAAHEAIDTEGRPLGIVHRDVTPQNVLLSYDGRVLLLDFGVAKFFEAPRVTESGVVKGKFGYMSPEQLMCQPLDRRSDVFALGVMLFELCTGRSLYSDLPPAAAALRIVSGPTPRLRDVLPVDARTSLLDEILARALAKAPDERFPTALELRDALRSYLARESSPPPELALLLQQDFSAEREAFELRLRNALRGGEGRDPVEAPPAPAGAPAGTRTAAIKLLSAPRAGPSRLPVLGAGAALVAVAVIAWASAAGSRADGPAPDPQSSVISEQAPRQQAVASTSVRAVSTDQVAPPSASALEAPASASPSMSARLARRPILPKASALPSASANAPPAPTPTVGGTPFRNL